MHTHLGDGQLGCPSAAPFNKLIVTCMVHELVPAWVEQLTPNGRIVAPMIANPTAVNATDTCVLTVRQKGPQGMQDITAQCLPKAPLYCQFVPLLPGQA